jgi:hypothetical protein
MAPLITLATAMAGMYRASKGFNGSGAPPPRQPDGNYNPGDKDER